MPRTPYPTEILDAVPMTSSCHKPSIFLLTRVPPYPCPPTGGEAIMLSEASLTTCPVGFLPCVDRVTVRPKRGGDHYGRAGK